MQKRSCSLISPPAETFRVFDELRKYALVVHCGACMLNEREMKSRIERAVDAKIPITNYGTAIAQLHGILKRSLSPFPDIAEEIS